MVAVMLPSLCQRHETVCFETFPHKFDGFRLRSTKHQNLLVAAVARLGSPPKVYFFLVLVRKVQLLFTQMIRDDSLVTDWCNLGFLNFKSAATCHVERHPHNGIAPPHFFTIKSMYGIFT